MGVWYLRGRAVFGGWRFWFWDWEVKLRGGSGLIFLEVRGQTLEVERETLLGARVLIFGGQGAELKERDVWRRDSQSCLSGATLYRIVLDTILLSIGQSYIRGKAKQSVRENVASTKHKTTLE